MALLHMLAGGAANGRELVCLTVDHGLRAEAREEAGFVADTCRALGIAYQRLVWREPRARQADARLARHRLLAEAARNAGASHILTGHTSDDQDETFLLRARQGSGWFGLSGMDPLSVSPAWPEGRGLLIARPLLHHSRAALRRQLRAAGGDWREDPTNENTDHERVRMRHLLGAAPQFRPHIVSCRARLALLRRAELGRLARLLQERVEVCEDAGLRLDPKDVPPETLGRLVSVLIQVAGGHANAPRGRSLNAVVSQITAGGPERARTLGGALLVREGAKMAFYRDPGCVDAPPSAGQAVWDGRFVRDRDADLPVPENRFARLGWPPEPAGWRPLAGQRLANLTNCWQKLSTL